VSHSRRTGRNLHEGVSDAKEGGCTSGVEGGRRSKERPNFPACIHYPKCCGGLLWGLRLTCAQIFLSRSY